MEFLRQNRKAKILRTRLYGDQEFTRFELELLHTPVLQRLYDLKQLGFTDRIFPDAVHARFNHIIGTTEVVDRMVDRLLGWLASHPADSFAYATDVKPQTPHQPGPAPKNVDSVTGEQLAAALRFRRPAIRMMALLHDVTHAAFGHTLEDEVNVFDEKHDAPARQRRFFDALVGQLLYLWCTEQRLRTFDSSALDRLVRLELSNGSAEELGWAEELAEFLTPEEKRELAGLLRQLELAFRLLLRLDLMHGAMAGTDSDDKLLVSDVAAKIDPAVSQLDFERHRDMFLIDLVGNTICADLLDYARRDAENAGLRVQFDDRFLRYLGVASVSGDLSPTSQACIRTAIQIFTDKMRQDVLSEMSGILKARYLINERVLFHPTKCAAGAMLGTAVQLLGLRDLPQWMQVLGDQQFLLTLSNISEHVEYICGALARATPDSDQPEWTQLVKSLWPSDPRMSALIIEIVSSLVPGATAPTQLTADQIDQVRLRAHSARNLLSRLKSRRLPKLAYRLRNAHHTGGDSDETIAGKYSTPLERYRLERRIEEVCQLPMGSVVIHCPKRKMSMKVAEAVVIGANLGVAARLREVTKVSPEGLEPYQREILAVEDMYKSIWQFHAYIDPTYWDKRPIVEWALERELGFPNDQLLVAELAQEPRGTYHSLVGELKDEVPPKWLPKVVRRIDETFETRFRHGRQDSTVERLRAIIREVMKEVGTAGEQLGLPGVGDEPNIL